MTILCLLGVIVALAAEGTPQNSAARHADEHLSGVGCDGLNLAENEHPLSFVTTVPQSVDPHTDNCPPSLFIAFDALHERQHSTPLCPKWSSRHKRFTKTYTDMVSLNWLSPIQTVATG